MNTRSIRFRLTVWYAGLLAGLIVLFGAAVYLGLSHYLEWTLRETLSQQAKQIGEAWLGEVGVSGESYVSEEINEHLLSPEVERALAKSEAVQIPLHRGVEGPENIPPIISFKPMTIDYGKAANRVEDVVKRLQPILGL